MVSSVMVLMEFIDGASEVGTVAPAGGGEYIVVWRRRKRTHYSH